MKSRDITNAQSKYVANHTDPRVVSTNTTN